MLHDRSSPETLHLEFEPSHRAASSARQAARAWIDGRDVPVEAAADVELIIAELVANAVEQQPRPPIRLELVAHADAVLVTLANRASGGEWPTPPAERPDGPPDTGLSERGRGLAIVEAISDEMSIDSRVGWTSVAAIRRY